MKDFLNWLNHDAPEWVSYVGLILFVFFVSWAAVLFGVFFIWVVRNGYWIVFAIPPAAAIWAILHAYKKSKEAQDE
jgi:hypothetical protein